MCFAQATKACPLPYASHHVKVFRECLVWAVSDLAEIDLGFDPSQCFLEYLHVGNRL
jgi:hypothetical protein